MKRFFSFLFIIMLPLSFCLTSYAENKSVTLGNSEESESVIIFSEFANQENTITLRKSDVSISFGLRNCQKSNLEFIGKSEIIYKDVLQDVDLKYINTNGELREDIILKTPNASKTFEIGYTTNGLTPVQANDKTIVLKNKDNQTVYKITTPVMIDANLVQSDKVFIKVISQNDDGFVAKITCDESWLKDAKREYPVVIDPNYTDEYFDITFDSSGYFRTTVRRKDTSSSVYLNLLSAKFSGNIKVRVLGAKGNEVIENKSFKGGKYVDHFLVSAGKKYVIYNKVSEDGLTAAQLEFQAPEGLKLKGCWSSDYDGSENCEVAQAGIVQAQPAKPSVPAPQKPEKLIKVPYLSQEGIRSGCESVSATMLLNYYGYKISPAEFISKFLPIKAVSSGRGPDPVTTFAGDPYGVGYGCFSPCMADSLNKVLDTRLRAKSQCLELQDLVDSYICKDVPVLIWITTGLNATSPGDSWIIEGKNKKFIWPKEEHCVVLVGFDKDNYYVNDPYRSKGVVAYPKEKIEFCFRCMGRHSVVIENN